MHDATKVVLGQVPNSCKDVTCEDADPADFPAGIAVRRSSTGGLLIADNSTAALIGISCGKDLGNSAKTAVVRTGLKVPLQLTDQAAYLTKAGLTFTADVAGEDGNLISIEFVDGGTAGAEDVTVTDNLISVSMDDGVSTATQLKTALDADVDAAALISVAIGAGQGGVGQAAFAEDFLENGGDSFVAGLYGEPVRVSTTTGKATGLTAGSVATAAIYASQALTGVKEDGTTTPVVLVDMIGGL